MLGLLKVTVVTESVADVTELSGVLTGLTESMGSALPDWAQPAAVRDAGVDGGLVRARCERGDGIGISIGLGHDSERVTRRCGGFAVVAQQGGSIDDGSVDGGDVARRTFLFGDINLGIPSVGVNQHDAKRVQAQHQGPTPVLLQT